MSDIRRISEQVSDLAERLADVADAAQGRGTRNGTLKARWLFLPAVGAGLYALVTNDAFKRQAKGFMDEAKARAAALPEELLPQETGGSTNGPSKRRQPTSTSSKRRSGQPGSKARSSR
jgi:hypothetical protein